MFNCHKQLKSFFDASVALTEDMKTGMRARRNANRDRLARGLLKKGNPSSLKSVSQGSYAMHTMVQSEYEASDIDDGVVFAKSDLVGQRGGELLPLDAKNMVRDAIDDGSFKIAPAVHTNCVRVFYNDGFTLDIPVYRETSENSQTCYELASTTWKKSNPEGVTNWFNQTVIDKSPDVSNGRQMRRIVRLLKAWSKSRKTWNMPSGFILSKLVSENYAKDMTLLGRDDKALLQVMEAIHSRLQNSLIVNHPAVAGETITRSNADANMVELRNRISVSINSLSALRKSDCTEFDALKVIKSMFDTMHFDDRIAELSVATKATENTNQALASVFATPKSEPSTPVVKKGGDGRYA